MQNGKRITARRAATGVLANIRALEDSFSSGQKALAEFVLTHSDQVPLLSVRDLARSAGVSVATASRFARQIGYRGFKDFKVCLGKDVLSAVETVSEAVSSRDSDEDVAEKVFGGNIRSLEETLNILDRGDLVRAAKAVAKADRAVFFGIGASGYVAQDAALRLSHLDIQAEAYGDSYQMVNQALRLRTSHVAFGISHSGRSAITVEAMELARSSGAMTIGLSNYLKSPLHRASDLFFCTSFPESRVKVAALSSRIAQMCLIDALYLLVARHRAVSARTERVNAYTETLLRYPTK